MCATLTMQTRQHLTMTPKLAASLHVLQLSSIELHQELRNAMDSNPFLEEDASTSESDDQPAHGVADEPLASRLDPEHAERGAAADTHERAAQDESGFDYADGRSGRGAALGGGDGPDSDPSAWAHIEPTLREQLRDALCLCQLNGRGRAAACVVIDALDDDGYLRQPLADLTTAAYCLPELTEPELRIALRLVQSLDKPGIGARSLSECLLLQLDAMPADTVGRRAARDIVEHHLERLARREMAQLQRQLGCDARTLQRACMLVRTLDPKPGHQYGGMDDPYVVPDVMVRRVNGRWTVTINPAVMPRARIHRLYAGLLAQSSGASHTPLGQQLQEARWLLRNVHRRFDTIRRVCECIVARQQAFFKYGEVALRPLVLRDVADELDMHESTVSRATVNKYMSTPHGIFGLRHFFPRQLDTDTGGTCSAAAVRVLLKDMIGAEEPHDPLSDATLARLLGERGVLVARRTVTKYRNAMKVPPVALRKRD